MPQKLADFVNNIDFSAFWQWLSNLPLIQKIFAILPTLAALIAIVVNAPKAYSRLRGIVVRLEVKKFTLVEREFGLVDFQLDLCIHASHGNATINGIYLRNKDEFHLQYNEPICLFNEPDTNEPSNKAKINLAIPKTDFEFTQFVEDRFSELFSMQLRDAQVEIHGFQVPEDSFKCLTMAGRLKGKIYDVNFSKIPLTDWSVLFEYGKRKAETTLKTIIIDDHQTRT